MVKYCPNKGFKKPQAPQPQNLQFKKTSKWLNTINNNAYQPSQNLGPIVRLLIGDIHTSCYLDSRA